MTKLIVSLDKLNPNEVKDIIGNISQNTQEHKNDIIYKFNDMIALIGLEGIYKLLKDQDVRIMLDPKWNDIPNTITNYMMQLHASWLAEMVDVLTIHANAWSETIKAAMKAKKDFGFDMKILAITALTSQDEDDTQDIYDEAPKHSVLKLAKLALDAGVDGVVCSGQETRMLREVYGEDFMILNPGVRFTGWKTHDQKRVMTPADAVERGVNYVVMGRPILEADDMSGAVKQFFTEIEGKKYNAQNTYSFDTALYAGTWKQILSYIGAFYFRPEGGKYCRLTSKLVSNAYINIGSIERYPLVIERATADMARILREKDISADVVLWAQMGSVRISLYLAEKLNAPVSIYTEKTNNDNNEMALKRHNINLKWKKVVISEDVVNRGSTLLKMIEIVQDAGWEVVAISCVANRSRKDEIAGIPLIACYIPEEFEIYYDDITPEEERKDYPQLPEGSIVSPKPKNEWDELVESMR